MAKATRFQEAAVAYGDNWRIPVVPPAGIVTLVSELQFADELEEVGSDLGGETRSLVKIRSRIEDQIYTDRRSDSRRELCSWKTLSRMVITSRLFSFDEDRIQEAGYQSHGDSWRETLTPGVDWKGNGGDLGGHHSLADEEWRARCQVDEDWWNSRVQVEERWNSRVQAVKKMIDEGRLTLKEDQRAKYQQEVLGLLKKWQSERQTVDNDTRCSSTTSATSPLLFSSQPSTSAAASMPSIPLFGSAPSSLSCTMPAVTAAAVTSTATVSVPASSSALFSSTSVAPLFGTSTSVAASTTTSTSTTTQSLSSPTGASSGGTSLEQQLELIETHQQEVEKALQSMEEDAERMYEDERVVLLEDDSAFARDSMYEQAEFIESGLQKMAEQIKLIIETVNAKQGGDLTAIDGMTPIDVVVHILNNQLSSLMWIDEKANEFSTRIKKLANRGTGSDHDMAGSRFLFN